MEASFGKGVPFPHHHMTSPPPPPEGQTRGAASVSEWHSDRSVTGLVRRSATASASAWTVRWRPLVTGEPPPPRAASGASCDVTACDATCLGRQTADVTSRRPCIRRWSARAYHLAFTCRLWCGVPRIFSSVVR